MVVVSKIGNFFFSLLVILVVVVSCGYGCGWWFLAVSLCFFFFFSVAIISCGCGCWWWFLAVCVFFFLGGSCGGSFLCLLLLVVDLVVCEWWVCLNVSGSGGGWVFKIFYFLFYGGGDILDTKMKRKRD